ncbi:MAG TPA: isoprenylcysteine carboxylmethyltransferase family protein [Methanoregulaceae archaeon]|nr:isoprenylcysteine carboxylmethyltransferase family protein [Methanoregulaceae archaeon]
MAQYFPTELASLYFIIVVILWILGEIIGSTITPAIRRRGVEIERKDKGSRIIIFVGTFLAIFIAFELKAYNIGTLPEWMTYFGTTLMLMGVIFRQWSISVLGKYFSQSIGIQKGQKIVKSGPYRYVRHPSYTGAFLIWLGIGFALQSWVAVIIILVIYGLIFGYRMKMEEEMLISEFGDEYKQYMKTTKKIIPFIL